MLNVGFEEERMKEEKQIPSLQRFFLIFFAVAGMIAVVFAALLEEPTPWAFLIAGPFVVLVCGYLGIKGSTPKWMQDIESER